MSPSETFWLLAGQTRPGAPEPTLLPWLTRRIARSGLPEAAAAAAGTTSAPGSRWPVIADAVAAIIAEREQDPGRLTGMLDILPPLAAHLGPEAGTAIDWGQVRDDAVGYAVLGGLPLPVSGGTRRRRFDAWPPWDAILNAWPLPPLADIGALHRLATEPADQSADTDQEAAYLLPFRSGEQLRWQALEAIDTAVSEDSYWFAAALLARAAPYLDRDGQASARTALARLPAFWSSPLARLADGPVARWPDDEAELAASHPAIPGLNDLAAQVGPEQLAAMAITMVRDIMVRHGLDQPWEPASGPLARITDHLTARSESYELIEGDHLRLMDAEPTERHLNVYVAAAGQEDPVPSSPLELDADYVLRCNIGGADYRSLVRGDDSIFPDDYLPDGPLQLRIVLFLDGRKAVIKPLELPEQGDSDWIDLPLPRVTEPSVLHGDVTVYYGAAIVLMYGLILPFGGDGAHGPEAVRRYQISRSLANLEELEGRTMSFAVSGPPTAPSIYMNDLTFAPAELRYDPREIDQGQFTIRTGFYEAHFSVQTIKGEVGEVSKYSPSPDFPFAKSAEEFDLDLRRLALDGSGAFNYLFPNSDHRHRLRRMLRTEAEAHGRPPVFQVVPLGEQPVPVPWAALYDLPLDDDIDAYERCRSIADFGPGESATTIPCVCPYEASHYQDDGRWKSNQLCPWGFWGLSTIIEHPPSTQTRDLETQVRPDAGPPLIMVGYDTGLDGKLRRDHLEKLKKKHGGSLLEPYADKVAVLKKQLGGDTMDVVYLYCHVIDDPARHVPAIQFDDGRVTSQSINSWHETAWPDRHWHSRHPLVVLNGCGSAEKGPGSLASLVGAFVETAGASGVIGTEIAIEQGLGGWAMELFLDALRDQPVGEALRSTRWKMLGGGNLIGLAYTPYCLAGLTVSPHGGG